MMSSVYGKRPESQADMPPILGKVPYLCASIPGNMQANPARNQSSSAFLADMSDRICVGLQGYAANMPPTSPWASI